MGEERDAIHINLISQTEMKAHTREMRSEMDRKFMETLIATGLTKLEAIERVREWNAQDGRGNYGN